MKWLRKPASISIKKKNCFIVELLIFFLTPFPSLITSSSFGIHRVLLNQWIFSLLTKPLTCEGSDPGETMIRIGSFELVSFTNLFKFKDVEGKVFMPKMNIYSNIPMDITQFREQYWHLLFHVFKQKLWILFIIV